MTKTYPQFLREVLNEKTFGPGGAYTEAAQRYATQTAECARQRCLENARFTEIRGEEHFLFGCVIDKGSILGTEIRLA